MKRSRRKCVADPKRSNRRTVKRPGVGLLISRFARVAALPDAHAFSPVTRVAFTENLNDRSPSSESIRSESFAKTRLFSASLKDFSHSGMRKSDTRVEAM